MKRLHYCSMFARASIIGKPLGGIVVWIIFILDFAIEFTLAPRKLRYLKSNWLTAVSLLVPALRVLRIIRSCACSVRPGDSG